MKPLSGEQIIEAARKGIEVLYTYKSYNELEKDRDLELRTVPELVDNGTGINIDEDETGFYWEVADLENINAFNFDLDHGSEAIYAADTLTERERRKEKLAKFLHEEVWSFWLKHMLGRCVMIDSPDHEHFGTGQIHAVYAGVAQRWERQADTKYEKLEPAERERDEELAEKLMVLLEEQ